MVVVAGSGGLLVSLHPPIQVVAGDNRVAGSEGFSVSHQFPSTCPCHMMASTVGGWDIYFGRVAMNLCLGLQPIGHQSQNVPATSPSRRNLHPSWTGVNALLLPDEKLNPRGQGNCFTMISVLGAPPTSRCLYSHFGAGVVQRFGGCDSHKFGPNMVNAASYCGIWCNNGLF